MSRKLIFRTLASVVLITFLGALATISLAQESKWTKKADMPTRRSRFSTSTVGGKIYAIGGAKTQPWAELSTVEEYDPKTDRWTKKADMPTARNSFTTSVANGKIYAIGGEVPPLGPSTIVEEYDPAADEWMEKSNTQLERYYLSASTVNGKVYVIGGLQPGVGPTAAVEEYDPITDTWTWKADMPTRRNNLSTSVVNGKIYAIGGYVGIWPDRAPTSIVEEYDPATDTWTGKTDMPTARASLSTSVVNGRIYAIGGEVSDEGESSSAVEEYDPATDTWRKVEDMPTARTLLSSSAVDGKIYAIGGQTVWPNMLGTVEEYTPEGWPFPRALATDPSPADEATDVPRDVVLNWTPGFYAPLINGHLVYFSESFNDVNDRIGGVAQSATSYAPPQRLDFNTTYYWRIDEVNAPPDSTIFKGDVWSFTTEPFAYPMPSERITATASSSDFDQGPEQTVNGSGLDVNNVDLHSTELTDMWITATDAPGPHWIQYEFDKVVKLHEMWVWNHNGMMELTLGLGIKEVTIEYSVNGTDYTTLGATHEFARGTGAANYAQNTTVDFGGVTAKYVKLTVNSNWGGLLSKYGLSEVRFLYIPMRAREPDPESGATDVDVDVTLSWRAGREAAEHNVSLSTDEQAVIDGTAPVNTVTEASYGTTLDLGSTYYWRVDEVNDAETPTTWQGDIWSLSTPEFLVVDDFELYNDLNTEESGSNRIYLTWIDGPEQPTNGSTIGYMDAPFTEQSIVHGGNQSMPFSYDNSTAGYSEATANVDDLPIGQDWTKHSIKVLVLYFHGDPANNVEQMYVKVNDTKVVYDGDASDIATPWWRQWSINLADLATLGVDLQNVRSLIIGFEKTSATGGSGVVFFDNIGLYSSDPEFFVGDVSLIENFASLAVGTNMHDVDGWEGWFDDAQWGARVTDVVAYSGTNSLEIVGNRDDLVPNWPQQTTGQWTLKVMQYCPSGKQTTGLVYFGPLAEYDSVAGTVGWIGEFMANFETGKAYCNQDQAIQVDLVYDDWAELRLEVDLYSQEARFYYNNVFLATRPATSITGVDIWPEPSIEAIYFDDFRFEAAE